MYFKIGGQHIIFSNLYPFQTAFVFPKFGFNPKYFEN